ncbi:hypothetical protein BDQ17DRAFT_1419885 [Cyathus striatus]|nr:hypothetical protein BDQ17DRAFT_1419885 [Cyathus striatus]
MEGSTSKAHNLDAFVTHSRPPPDPLATSQEIRDRSSIFVGSIYHASSPEEAKARMNHLKNVVHGQKRASHEIAAWRCMVLKKDCTGLRGPDDFELTTGYTDDGEKYGGELLGPARFSHIETCTLEVCKEFKRNEELRECIATLRTLDDILADLRAELASLSPEKSSTVTPSSSLAVKKTKPDYSNMDVAKIKRLTQARENAINSIKALLAKRKKAEQ